MLTIIRDGKRDRSKRKYELDPIIALRDLRRFMDYFLEPISYFCKDGNMRVITYSRVETAGKSAVLLNLKGLGHNGHEPRLKHVFHKTLV